MRAHLVPNMQDHENARRIKILAHRRKRCFEYLKRKDLVRYNQCLMEVGVDKRAVEGELVIHRWWCVKLSLPLHILLHSGLGVRSLLPCPAHVGSGRTRRPRHDEQTKTQNTDLMKLSLRATTPSFILV